MIQRDSSINILENTKQQVYGCNLCDISFMNNEIYLYFLHFIMEIKIYTYFKNFAKLYKDTK